MSTEALDAPLFRVKQYLLNLNFYHMRKTFLPLACALFAAMLFISCQEDNASGKQVSQEVLDQIWNLGFSNQDVIKIDEGYLVEGDIILTEENLNDHSDHTTLRIAETEQYRTTNQVNGPRTITISVDTKLTDLAGYSAAVDVMIARYNAENLELTFVRAGSSGGNIHLKKQTGNFLASAGFPSGGNPYSLVKINTNMMGQGSSSTFINFCASVIAHEIGHCIGLRHTDYMNRAYSCGGAPTNEGSGGVGAIHIPGTPSSPDANSWMLSCTSLNENRPFNANDKTALDYLY